MPCAARARVARLDGKAPGGVERAVFRHPVHRVLLILGLALAAAASADELTFGRVRVDPRTLPATPIEAGERLRLVQFQRSPTQGDRDALLAAGLRPLQYYPRNAWLAWGDGSAAWRAAVLPGVRWQGELPPAWKRSPELDRFAGRIDQLHLLAYDDGRLPLLLAEIAALGGALTASAPAQPDRALLSLYLRIDAARLPALQQWPSVLWLEYQSPRAGLDDELASQIVAGRLDPEGAPPLPDYLDFLATLGLDGSGVRFAVTDTGIDYAHPELGPRIVAGHDYPGCDSAPANPGDDRLTGGHGSHVAGIIAGRGALSGAVDEAGFHHGIGVAPAIELVALNPICGAPGGGWPPAGGWQALSQRALQLGAIGSNNSWHSNELLGLGYGASARTHDFIVRDGDFDSEPREPFVLVFSAGNGGPQAGTISAPKEAKNVIVVGNSLSARPIPRIDEINGASARGPALDGRILPTVVAPGTEIASARRIGGASYCAQALAASGPNADYAYCTGTSMAAPQVSGVLALLVQDWRAAHAGATPSPALLKALLVDGAVDLLGAPPVPNNDEGWGRVNLQRSLGDGVERIVIDQEQRLDADGESFSSQWTVPNASQPLRLTLVWSDAPAAPGASPALVNDLDLVVRVDGREYRGNQRVDGHTPAGAAADRLNNIEQLLLPAASADLVEVRVEAHALPGDGVPGSGDETDQDFALVCSNCSSEPAFSLALDESSASLCAGQALERELQLQPLLEFEQPVTLDLGGWPAPGSAAFDPPTLTELPGSSRLRLESSGVVRGEYPLSVAANGGGVHRTRQFSVYVADSTSNAPQLQDPPDGATGLPRQPTLRWNGAAYDYRVEIAADPEFRFPVSSAQLREREWTPPNPLDPGSTYYWRVFARNACDAPELFADRFEDLAVGAGAASPGRSFGVAANRVVAR